MSLSKDILKVIDINFNKICNTMKLKIYTCHTVIPNPQPQQISD